MKKFLTWVCLAVFLLVGRYLDRRRWVYHDDDDPADNN